MIRALLAAWPQDRSRFDELVAAIPRWGRLLDHAERHAVTGILSRPLLEPHGPLPLADRTRLEERSVAERLWQQQRVAALDQVLAVLAQAQVRTIALKGPVLSERLYGDPLVRLSNDLDLLVPAEELNRSIEVLAPMGYRLGTKASVQYYLRHHHHLVMDCPGWPTLELHFRLYAGFGVVLDAEEFLARSHPYRTDRGSQCHVLTPEDELLYLGIHAAGHGCERLAWLYDLKALLLQQRRLDWPSVFARARAWGVVAALAFALEMARRRIGVPANGWKHPAARYCQRSQIAEQVWALAESLPLASLRNLGDLACQAILCDRPARSVRLVGHHLGRVARRRLQRYLPNLTPVEWSG